MYCGRSWTFLFLAGALLTGCHTVPKPEPELATVTLAKEASLAPPAPLEGALVSPQSIRSVETSGAPADWPAQWGDGWIALEGFCRFLGVKLSSLASAAPNPAYRIDSERGRLEIRANTRLAAWNGVQFWMAYGPRLVQDEPCVHALDARKNLLPFLQTAPLDLTGRKVVIDPGHGGRDLGSQSAAANAREKDLTLDWALRVRSLLTARGWQVVLTRTNDADLTLAERVGLADRARADLFLSLHFNSALPVTDRTGIETYCLTPAGLPSTLVRFGQDDPAQVHPNNAFDDRNLLLAFRIHRQLVQRTGAVDGGIRRARFMSVLRDQARPAILIEGGYLSTPSEAQNLIAPAHRQVLAEAVAAGLEGL